MKAQRGEGDAVKIWTSLFSIATVGACGGNAREWPFAVSHSAGIVVVTETSEAEGEGAHSCRLAEPAEVFIRSLRSKA